MRNTKSINNETNNNINRHSLSIESENRESLIKTDTYFSKPKQFVYNKSIEYWLVTLGLAIGFGSFWRFPYLIYSNG